MPRRSSMRSIDGRSLDLDDVVGVARKAERVALAPAAAKRVDASRRALEKVIAKGSLAYGIKTGFGELASVEISDADVRTLQLNLLRSHAIGQGPPLRRRLSCNVRTSASERSEEHTSELQSPCNLV